jgi:hypothetical protein
MAARERNAAARMMSNLSLPLISSRKIYSLMMRIITERKNSMVNLNFIAKKRAPFSSPLVGNKQ